MMLTNLGNTEVTREMQYLSMLNLCRKIVMEPLKTHKKSEY